MFCKFESCPLQNKKGGYMKIKEMDCVGCGQCADICPAGAIVYDMKAGRVAPGYSQPKIIIDECIECGSCKEICPGEAIE